MVLLLMAAFALLVTCMHVACGTPKLLLPLNSQPRTSSDVPAPLICKLISPLLFVTLKLQPLRLRAAALVCAISVLFRLKLNALTDATALLVRTSPVEQRARSPAVIMRVVLDPV